MKGFKGGYKIVSLQLNDITSDFTLSGIYNDIKDSHDKPILVSEIVVNGEKMNDAYTIVKKDDTDFIIEVYGYALTVASDDSVTVAEISKGVTSIGGVEGEITLGEGLAITEEGELSTSGESGKVYTHIFGLSISSTGTLCVQFISSSNTPSTFKDFMEKIRNTTAQTGYEMNPYVTATGRYFFGGVSGTIVSLIPKTSTTFVIYGVKTDGSLTTITKNYNDDVSVNEYKIVEM